ncbi:alpha/beta fold hydrolase [Caballeronia novacaledonica]|uniref:Alpha/beta hydrolase n=1 Tax=Caballeronia novacaledonica TaxID=1544861 RepID=A0AA37IDM3_9BURK|nr:alpha/beta hydrolase [Caballeronia novacaledonica]GJH27443.1 alpha/beta hydrolase [Caballeronia novacaledonica]
MNNPLPIEPVSAPSTVIALHCSGSGASQWRKLGEALGSRVSFVAPEHYGCDSTGPWSGERAFTLADEAGRTVDIIDAARGKVHLVGHSYGGGVALRVAMERPERIATLSLYEPSAFHLLRTMGKHGAHALAEIDAISKRTADSVSCGDYRGAAASFVDYWGGDGAWEALRPSVKAALTRWAPKAPLDFRALLDEPTSATAYASLRMPVLVMRGEHAPLPTRALAERLPILLSSARLAIVPRAGHMGPLTHADEVNAAITRHIFGFEAHRRPRDFERRRTAVVS